MNKDFDLYRIILRAPIAPILSPKELPNLFGCLIRTIFLTLKRLILVHDFKYPTAEGTVFMMLSSNNRRALEPIIKQLPENEIYSIIEPQRNFFPLTKMFLYSLFYLPSLLKHYYKAEPNKRLLFRLKYKETFTAYGWYKIIERFYRRNPKITTIVLANDHTLPANSIKELAKTNGIKIIYTQHASVTSEFPPLDFDYCFLDGLESFDKYKAAGKVNSIVFISGSPRFDEIRVFKNKRAEMANGESRYVGVAMNALDIPEKIFDLCCYLKKFYSVIIRPHPASKLELFNTIKEAGFEVSDSKKESPFAFLSKINCLVANESGIHLDAALMEVPSFLYNFSNNKILDWYSFIKSGLIKEASTKEELVDFIRQQIKPSVKSIKYYNAAYDTPFEGAVGGLIANFIISLNKGYADDFIKKTFSEIEPNTFEYK